jgi:predicted transcriptional regulator
MIEKIIVEINVPIEKVFLFMCGYDKHYTEVSDDHIERVVNIKDPNLEHPDVSFYFRQKSPVTGREQKIRGKVTRVEMNRYIGTRFLFPTSLVLTQVEEILEPEGEGCLLTTNLHFTFLAHLMQKSIRKVVEHITGELEETKRILENQAKA